MMASNVELKIHHVQGSAMAFSLDHSLYFLRTNPIPQIFDGNLTLQLIANIDSWFQAKTQQRYSYRNMLDMMDAFAEGLKHTYSPADLEYVVRRAALVARSYILTQRMGDYSKLYWIEALDPAKLETTHVPSIREKFEHLKEKLGVDGFYNYLCRLWAFANHHRQGLVPTLEKLIRRLDRIPQNPTYPDSSDLDRDLQMAVLAGVLERETPSFKHVDPVIQAKLGALNYVERNTLDS